MINCGKCKTTIDLDKEKMQVRNGKQYKKCPNCGTKYLPITTASGLKRDKTGKLVNTNKKVRMSKKMRLKLRKTSK